MKLTTALSALALIAIANAAVTGYCTPGLNYCSGVLNDVGDNNAAISDALRRSGHSSAISYPGVWGYFLFRCNGDQSLDVIQECDLGCRNNGAGNSDTC
ncbi:hypothetical protein AbraIFM66951_007896 [Aspergillus brasiliensis]|uniref:Uncharacterized protein n=1 Tax=Aspergillus brasiliensis TaxID=319629 RepID=A0A9W5Z1E8_9EURO|nr:hypothetical protein AbraCBS73388_002976 [Aspergillus brasiliensis]GKZ51878.1 hypothetical protein AbraIFM66951_007896 [Aspergillus brasiliensis]